MAILNRDDYVKSVHGWIDGNTSEEAIKFAEDMLDTYNDLESRKNDSGEDWEKKYHELDEQWRTKYVHRFFHGGDSYTPEERHEETPEERAETITIEDLFTEKKE